MRVIKRGNEREVKCPKCRALLYYTTSDIEITGDLESDYYHSVRCPECQYVIKITL